MLEVTRTGRVILRAPKRASKQALDAFVKDKQAWIETQLAKQAAARAARPDPTPAETDALKQLAKKVLPERVAYYAERMQLYPTGIRITTARTRFGSCSAKNRLCFSLYLMQYPEDAIDYVVVHELAHIRHKNHGPGFHALVASVLPNHKAMRTLLRS